MLIYEFGGVATRVCKAFQTPTNPPWEASVRLAKLAMIIAGMGEASASVRGGVEVQPFDGFGGPPAVAIPLTIGAR